MRDERIIRAYRDDLRTSLRKFSGGNALLMTRRDLLAYTERLLFWTLGERDDTGAVELAAKMARE